MASLTDGRDVDWGSIPSRIEDKIHHVSTAVRVIDFLISNWWWILAIILVLAWLPRGRRSS